MTPFDGLGRVADVVTRKKDGEPTADVLEALRAFYLVCLDSNDPDERVNLIATIVDAMVHAIGHDDTKALRPIAGKARSYMRSHPCWEVRVPRADGSSTPPNTEAVPLAPERARVLQELVSCAQHFMDCGRSAEAIATFVPDPLARHGLRIQLPQQQNHRQEILSEVLTELKRHRDLGRVVNDGEAMALAILVGWSGLPRGVARPMIENAMRRKQP